ncbi:MAG: response regulator transcription factor [Treponema sp.]|nr:response regulator transcription factor [Treponema sp.]
MKNIVLLDDHPVILGGISALLERNSEWKVIAKLGSINQVNEFLAEYQSSDIQTVALLDIELNGESGFDAIPLFVNRGINVLMYSMFSSSAYILRSSELGAKGYLSKSTSEEEILQALSDVAEGKPYIQKDFIPKLIFTANIMNSLTKKEKIIIDYVNQDLENNLIAEKMGISVRTVENHLSHIYDKFGVQNKLQIKEMISLKK